ncbi:MAG TPA: OmpA family protein [Elusimicrobiota bacterium]|nr:OmpA family protein [Elusimicrobiota bacterium]
MRKNRKEDLESQLNRSALWAVTYGDLMSYLMIFFLIMFSMGLGKVGGSTNATRQYMEAMMKIQKVFGGASNSEMYQRVLQRGNEESVANEIRKSLGQSVLSKETQVVINDQMIRLTLASGVLFGSGSAVLTSQAKSALAQVAKELARIPNDIVVEGHTDNVPIHSQRYNSNWELSMARAYTVIVFFQAQGITPKRLAGIGYGQYRPVADNATAAGRAKNRRIEIDIMRTQ